MDNNTKKLLKKEIVDNTSYFNDFQCYIDNAGWQSWMNEYCESQDELTEKEIKEIEAVQREIWTEVKEEELENFAEMVEVKKGIKLHEASSGIQDLMNSDNPKGFDFRAGKIEIFAVYCASGHVEYDYYYIDEEDYNVEMTIQRAVDRAVKLDFSDLNIKDQERICELVQF